MTFLLQPINETNYINKQMLNHIYIFFSFIFIS